ncbi:hypothetical protein FRC04_009325 [Tulasnella sp. 424]|nr:hypothetical protein FRC04_009325 [Tulasnella sp. 424]KAG8973280.1 hypothetical protein FRC05_008995 [Tulasnella sp. 425]
MKPPRKGAITKALAILMESINEENGSQLAYEHTAALDSASLETLAGVDNALGIANSCISQVINSLIADIRYRRNRAALIHQLPAEVFTTIVTCLTDDYAPKEGERHMLDLMVVSRRWRDIILNSPELWTNIRSDHPAKFVKLITERSKAHPLSLAWDTSRSPDLDSNNEGFKSMLELVTRNSLRLRSMEITVGCGSQQTLRRLLDCPKPRLESLYVNLYLTEVDDIATRRFMLSEGGPLKKLVLDSAGLLDWDSSRLSGLRVLNLRKPASIPSINQILLILSTSPLLTQLKLCEFDSPAGTPSAQTEQTGGEQLIELPHLKTISIRDLPPSYCTSILSRILPRFCDYVDVLENEDNSANTMPWEELWRERSDTMVALLQLSKLSDPNLAENSILSIRVTDCQVMIKNAPQPESYSSTLWFEHTDAHHALEVLGEFFGGIDFKIPSLSLRLERAPTWKHKQLDLHQWSCSLEILHVDGIHMARAVCKLLEHQSLLEDGTMSWSCPRLSIISLFYIYDLNVDERTEMDDGMALLLAVQKRWSGENGIPAAIQPKQFWVWCRDGIFTSIQSRAEAIRLIVPSFQMIQP